MSIKVILLIWEEHTGFLTGIEKAVLIRLADFGSDDGSQIYPGKKRLADDTGFSLTTVKKVLGDLEVKKIIVIKNRKQKIQNITNIYSINVKLLKKLSEKTPVDKSKGGGAPRALGRAPRAPGGRAPRDPDPLNSNRYINNNRTAAVDSSCGKDPGNEDPSDLETRIPRNSQKEKTKAPKANQEDVVVNINSVLISELAKYNISEKTTNEWILRYGSDMVLQKLKLLQETLKNGTPIRNHTGWLNSSLIENFRPYKLSKSTSLHSSHQMADKILQESDLRHKIASQPGNRKKGQEILNKLKGRI